MKKILSNIYTLAALLMAGTAFTACSSSDDIIEQPANPTEPQVYTLVIKASKGDANTRALSLSGSTLNAYWSGEETIEVYQDDVKIGTATAAASASGNTTITATLTSAPDPKIDLNFYLGGKDPVYTGQNGLLTGTGSISEKYDYVESLIYSNAYTVEGYNVIPGEFTTLNFTDGITHQAVIKFTLKDKGNSDAAISPTALTVTDGTSTVELTNIPEATYTANGGAGVLYVAFPAAGSERTITLTATVGSDTYTYTTPSAKTFVNGKYYEVTVKMTRVTYPITLNEVTSAYVGSVVTTDGTVYATKADAIAANKTAAGMIAYVSGIGQGLAIALDDESGSMGWSTAKSTCEGKTAVTGGTWRLPSAKDWQYMFIGCGSGESYSDPSEEMKKSYSGLASKLTTAGGTALQVGENYNYWSSSEYDISEYAWSLRFVGNDAIFLFGEKDLNAFVRACLAFGSARGHALASSAVGEIVGSDGLAYYASDKNDLPSGVTAVAMVAYKNGNNGLAIALADESGTMDWSTAITTAAAHTPAVTGGTWRLPSKEDWENMFIACGGKRYNESNVECDGLAEKLSTAGGTALQMMEEEVAYPYYWSSTEKTAGSSAWILQFQSYMANFIESYYVPENINYVRACLAF